MKSENKQSTVSVKTSRVLSVILLKTDFLLWVPCTLSWNAHAVPFRMYEIHVKRTCNLPFKPCQLNIHDTLSFYSGIKHIQKFMVTLDVYLFSACKMLGKNKPRNKKKSIRIVIKTHRFIMQSWKKTCVWTIRELTVIFLMQCHLFTPLIRNRSWPQRLAMAVLSCLWGGLMSNDEYMH